MLSQFDRFLHEQKWVDPLTGPLQNAVNSLYAQGGPTGKAIKNFLNGVWLGHPLHPVITDVPVGAWTTTMVLDVVAARTDEPALETAADLALATGLVSAVGAAVSGLTDWSDTYGEESRVGLLHGLLMVATTVSYALSLVARRAGARSAGVALSTAGYGLLSVGAYLGGDEVYDIGYGVNHTAFTHGPSKFVPVIAEADLPENQPTKAQADGVSVLLVKQNGAIYALDDTCVHAGCSLAGGTLQDRSIICPCHGSQYDLLDGTVLNGPATMPEPYYDVRIQNGQIEVKQAAH